jgi:uncharacterized protein involved in cysteine biosynthesis
MNANRRRDYYAGCLVALIGAGAAYEGSTYEIGSLQEMGSGFFPTLIGILLVLIGIIITLSASTTAAPADPHQMVRSRPDWRGWSAIIAGVLLFILLAQNAGLLPATFACVFVAAMGDRSSTWKEALLLAGGVTAFGIGLFAFGLKVQIPIFWGY